MIPKHFRLAVLLVCTTPLSSQCGSPPPAASEPSPFRLDGRLEKLQGRPILRLELTNRSLQPVEVKRRELAWDSDGLLQMIAVVESDQETSLPFAQSVGHIYDLGTAVLQPGESLEGKVELLHRFPTLLDMEHRRPKER